MIRVGITGNMGCGKSTVAKLLAQKAGVLHFDTDTIAKDILIDLQHREQVLDILGGRVEIDGQIDFKAVANVLFNNEELLQAWEAFVHPRLWGYIDDVLAEAYWVKIALIESAILYERKLQQYVDGVIVVYCADAEQYRRLNAHRGMSVAQIKKRLARQWPQEQKRERADVAVDTHCSMDLLQQKVDGVYAYITGPNFTPTEGES